MSFNQELLSMVFREGLLFVAILFLLGLWRTVVSRLLRGGGATENTLWKAAELPGYLLAVFAPFYVYCSYREFAVLRPDWFLLARMLLNASIVVFVGEIAFFAFLRSYSSNRSGNEFPTIFRQLLKGIVYLILFLSFLSNTYKIDITPLLTTSAVFTMVLGLALQDVLGNLFAGLSVHISPPFRIGNWIKINDFFGRVEESNWRATTLRLSNNAQVVIPNNHISKNEIINYSDASGAMFKEFTIGLSYEVSPERIRRILTAAARHVEGIYNRPSPVVSLVEFAESTINYKIRFWTSEDENPERITGQLASRIWYRLKREGLSVPFPIRDIYLHHEKDDRQKIVEHRMNLISGVDFIASLDQSLRTFIAERLEECWYENGEEIVVEGSFDSDFYIIDRGKVCVFISSAGQKPVAELGEGEFFGEMSLLTGEKRSASVVAKAETRLLKLNRDAMGRLLSENEALAEKLSKTLAERSGKNSQILAASQERQQETAQKPVDENVAKAAILRRIRSFFKL